MKRHNQILIGILIVQVALSVFVFWPKPSTAVEREPLFPDLKADDVVALTITDAEGNSVTLRQEAGDWVLPEADDYPAQGEKIGALLKKIAELTTGRLVTRTDTSHKRLQVAPGEFVRRIDFETADGAERTLYLGSSPRYGALHFRLEGQSETYLTDALSTFDANAGAASWIDASYVSVPQGQVDRMTLENVNGAFVFERGDEDKWTMVGLAEDETLDEAQVTGALRQAASVRMTRPLGREGRAGYGLDEPSAVATLETITETVTLRVGAQDPEDNSYVVKSSASPYYVRVAEAGVKALLERTREDFLQQPPTPEAPSDES